MAILYKRTSNVLQFKPTQSFLTAFHIVFHRTSKPLTATGSHRHLPFGPGFLAVQHLTEEKRTNRLQEALDSQPVSEIRPECSTRDNWEKGYLGDQAPAHKSSRTETRYTAPRQHCEVPSMHSQLAAASTPSRSRVTNPVGECMNHCLFGLSSGRQAERDAHGPSFRFRIRCKVGVAPPQRVKAVLNLEQLLGGACHNSPPLLRDSREAPSLLQRVLPEKGQTAVTCESEV